MHLPPILPNHAGPWYASLSCSHLNMALRGISNGIPSPLCDLRTLLEQKSLKNAVEHGHKWWILPETCPPETQVDIMTWRNQDQNENQATHEMELLLTLKHASQMYLAAGKKNAIVGDLIGASQRRNLPNVNPIFNFEFFNPSFKFRFQYIFLYIRSLFYFHKLSKMEPTLGCKLLCFIS